MAKAIAIVLSTILLTLTAGSVFAADAVETVRNVQAAFEQARTFLAAGNSPAAYGELIRVAVHYDSLRAERAAARVYQAMSLEEREVARKLAAEHRQLQIISQRQSTDPMSADDF